jgi:hypothetical protein
MRVHPIYHRLQSRKGNAVVTSEARQPTRTCAGTSAAWIMQRWPSGFAD